MSSDARRSLGEAGEQLAVEHVQRLGWTVIERNHRTRYGEIDVIALDCGTIVFIEVKTGRRGGLSPWVSLHERKQARVRMLAGAWFSQQRQRPRFEKVRCDAIGIVLDAAGELVGLEHIEGAF